MRGLARLVVLDVLFIVATLVEVKWSWFFFVHSVALLLRL